MKEWNERRLETFFRLNFDKDSCSRKVYGSEMTVTDSNNESIHFVIRENRIFSNDTNKFYEG